MIDGRTDATSDAAIATGIGGSHPPSPIQSPATTSASSAPAAAPAADNAIGFRWRHAPFLCLLRHKEGIHGIMPFHLTSGAAT
eukprot:scaffold29259_cov24-Tisochrysis_lutea.AAC.1